MFKRYYLIYIRREIRDGLESISPVVIQEKFIFKMNARKRMKYRIQQALDEICQNPNIPMDVKMNESFAEIVQGNRMNSTRIQIYLTK